MASAESKSLDTPDETRTPDKTMVSVVHLGSATIARLQVEPGWRWSECIKPVVGGESCQAAHLGYIVSVPETPTASSRGMTRGCSAMSRSSAWSLRARPPRPTPRAELAAWTHNRQTSKRCRK
jgi:hypothetical protein